MSARLIIEVVKTYPNDMDLTAYEGCDTVVEAAKLDKEMFENDAFSLDELVDSKNVEVNIRVMGDIE